MHPHHRMTVLVSAGAAEFSAVTVRRATPAGSKLAQLGWIGGVAVIILSALATGCSGAGAAEDDDGAVNVRATQSTETKIFGGSPDDERISGVVALKIGNGDPFEICSGALVAPNLVLTARHCVSKMVTNTVVCTDRGTSANGAHLGDDFPTDAIHVFVGEQPDFRSAPAATATAILHPEGTSLCNSDIAFIVLDATPAGATTLPVRLDKGVQASEQIRAIGYGKTDVAAGPGKRMRRDGVGILEVGAKLTASDTALGNHEFEVGQSICQGDSGGPSISETTGAVVGIVSRGADCTQNFGHVYTQTAGFESLFAQALTAANTTMVSEDGATLNAEDLSVSIASNSNAAAASDTTQARAQNGGCSLVRVGKGDAGRTSPGTLSGLAAAMAAIVTIRRRRSAAR